jgi:hypothetical protein
MISLYPFIPLRQQKNLKKISVQLQVSPRPSKKDSRRASFAGMTKTLCFRRCHSGLSGIFLAFAPVTESIQKKATGCKAWKSSTLCLSIDY